MNQGSDRKGPGNGHGFCETVDGVRALDNVLKNLNCAFNTIEKNIERVLYTPIRKWH